MFGILDVLPVISQYTAEFVPPPWLASVVSPDQFFEATSFPQSSRVTRSTHGKRRPISITLEPDSHNPQPQSAPPQAHHR